MPEERNEQVHPIMRDFINGICPAPKPKDDLVETLLDIATPIIPLIPVECLPSAPNPDDVNDRIKEDKLIEDADEMRHSALDRTDEQKEIDGECRRDQRVSCDKVIRETPKFNRMGGDR